MKEWGCYLASPFIWAQERNLLQRFALKPSSVSFSLPLFRHSTSVSISTRTQLHLHWCTTRPQPQAPRPRISTVHGQASILSYRLVSSRLIYFYQVSFANPNVFLVAFLILS
ncbi:hypothetical protein TorRG33x02_191940 [Trema orientale]|uniref:Uncharacterized protein n=1 Tax=Trema orientale TaxID=63057 RepID=A0A2P5EHD3_TREOI|nr:hypothetical protein TorRG33x02_191940 [Trema orientale]